jgi:GNAT superfamily N-acetyltransferase
MAQRAAPIPRERDGLRVVTVRDDLVDECARLERACFPHADPAELLDERDIAASARIFPEGFFVVLDGDRVVAQAAGVFVEFDFTRPQHRIVEFVGEFQCANHRDDAPWYYGTDMVVAASHRGRGIARWLYDLRKELVMRRGKRGIIAGAHLPGFAAEKHRMTAEAYIGEVASGARFDPTLSVQLRNGFTALCALEDYLRDTATDSWAALIRWDNPYFDGGSTAP